MAKELCAINRQGQTFGMEVDGVRAAAVMKKAFTITEVVKYGDRSYTRKKSALKANQIASLMREAAWLVVELHDFVRVQFDDSQWYEVVYD